jgi:hypothetical protein
MPDDPTKKRPQDASRVSLQEPWEVKYWTERFGVTAEQLQEAVNAVGNSVREVEEYLGVAHQ